MAKIFGTENLELAEDVVQDTFVAALQNWRLKGVPTNPTAWLFQVAKNKALDLLRRKKFSERIDFNDPERKLLASEYTLSLAMEQFWREDAIQDEVLGMMYACCHADVQLEAQIALMLKTLCGFTTAEIAKAFLTTEDTISKRLYRAKNIFREQKIRPEIPSPDMLPERTGIVLRAIYLIFNEGYNSTHSTDLIRRDLLDHAIYLCQLLCDHPQTQSAAVFAAMALMLFHAARVDGRLSEAGEIILLEQQDRSGWKRDLIAKGAEFLSRASFGDRLSPYHVEAAIAWEHCSSPSFDETRWDRILNYYDMLAQLQPSAWILLNRLMVVRQLFGQAEALRQMEGSPHQAAWEAHYLYHSFMAELLAETDRARAKICLNHAMELTQSEVERRLLLRKMEELGLGS